MSNFKWDLYGHPKNRNLKTVVGYAALNSRASTVHIVVPLYDIRDDDKDGKYGWGEWAWRWVPGVGSMLDPLAEVELLEHIAMDFNDGGLLQKARQKMIAEAFKAATAALASSVLGNAVDPAIAIVVKRAGLTLFQHYLIKQGSDQLLEKVLGVPIS